MNGYECRNGHRYTDENTYIHTDGSRRCRRCNREHRNRKRAEQHAATRTTNRANTVHLPAPVVRPVSYVGEAWRDNAACANIGGDLWFPDSSEAQVARRAKAICATCPVREICLRRALEDNETEGIWGGTSPQERKQLRRG